MIEDILVLYWAFSTLFMIGYIDTTGESIATKLAAYIIVSLASAIMFPICIGYYVRKKLINYGRN